VSELTSYRDKIRIAYDMLSRSYRRVADYILTNYYEVSFMTAAQLAATVEVDTTTVVRFSQRLGYNGYPELLHEIREQVKAEIYSAYAAAAEGSGISGDPFREVVQRAQHHLGQLLVHNPPEHLNRLVSLLNGVQKFLLIGEGYTASLAEMAAGQLRHAGFSAWSSAGDPALLAAALATLEQGMLVIGVSGTSYNREVARAMQFARSRGCATLGVVGSLSSPVNRMSDLVIYAPAEAEGALPSLVALTAALSGLVALASGGVRVPEHAPRDVAEIYDFLRQPDTGVPEEDAG